MPGVPPSDQKKTFFSLVQSFYVQSYRARRADHEYHIFIDIQSDNKKDIKTFLISILNNRAR